MRTQGEGVVALTAGDLSPSADCIGRSRRSTRRGTRLERKTSRRATRSRLGRGAGGNAPQSQHGRSAATAQGHRSHSTGTA
eukprot:15184224-Alexandrium_andersonii.AAC.1